jgi:hypothetical protein
MYKGPEDVHGEALSTLLKKTQEDLNKWTVIRCYWMEELML